MGFINIAQRVVSRYATEEESTTPDVGTFELPEDHMFGMEVPEGGSNCAKCAFAGEDGEHCTSNYFIKWQQSLAAEDPSKLPAPATSYCCDVFVAKK